MNAYVYRADMFCETCGIKTQKELTECHVVDDGDSDIFPQGPYPDGGGEADSPQYCCGCGAFLFNPLTEEGRDYVIQVIGDYLAYGHGDPNVLYEWADYYGLGAKDIIYRSIPSDV